jgi:hypothetical protein
MHAVAICVFPQILKFSTMLKDFLTGFIFVILYCILLKIYKRTGYLILWLLVVH